MAETLMAECRSVPVPLQTPTQQDAALAGMQVMHLPLEHSLKSCVLDQAVPLRHGCQVRC